MNYRRTSHTLWLFIVCTLVSLSAYATPPLELPWQCDEQYTLTLGHNAGSHFGLGKWAWDFSLLVGDIVVAPADGVIRLASDTSTTHGCDISYSWDANYVVLDFQDGTEALFLHLQKDSLFVEPGYSVRAGEPLARVGLSGWVCGAHLHFQIQEPCATWWCQSIPGHFEQLENPRTGQSFRSQNCPSHVSCIIPPDEASIIDERSDCFQRKSSQWWESNGGIDERFDYTLTRASIRPGAAAQWHFETEVSGLYHIEAYIPELVDAETANYYIHSSHIIRGPIMIDQKNTHKWVSLGNHHIEAGDSSFVQLIDNVANGYENQLLGVDAIRISFVTDDRSIYPELEWGYSASSSSGESQTSSCTLASTKLISTTNILFLLLLALVFRGRHFAQVKTSD